MIALVRRVQTRYTEGEFIPPDDVIEEYLMTVIDRLCIRLGCDELPERGESIAVDATMKALRLRGYEGSSSEAVSDEGSFSVSFIDDVLSAYSSDIAALRRMLGSSGVRFL